MKKFLRNLLFPTLLTSTFCVYAPIIVAVAIIFTITSNANARLIIVDNMSNSVWGGHMYIKHVSGATEGDDGNYDARCPPFFPNPLHIYSHNYYSGLDYGVDARPPNSTTTYNLHLMNIGFSGTADNFLRFTMMKDTDFLWKNIFLGDATDSNDTVADIKYVIAHGGVYPPPYDNIHYGDFPLPPVEGSNTGVYDKRKVFFFNHADLIRDRKIDFGDLEIFAQNFGRDERTEPNDPNNTLGAYVGKEPNDLDAYSDINRDGVVDFKDFSLFSGEWLWDANDPNTWSRVR
jgi:hypothetical protein